MKQIGKSIICLDRVDSTNNFIANLLNDGKVDHGTVILAEEQTNGRGQRGASWQSEGGMNLTFSFYVSHHNLSVQEQPQIVHMVSLTLIQLLNEYGIESKVKWPNDILVNDRKIAGILIENQLEEKRIKSSIIGIGLNVNQTNFNDLPATSLKTETNTFYPVKDVLYKFVNCWNQALSYSKSKLEESYLTNLWKVNEELDFLHEGMNKRGKIIGTTSDGLLKIETPDELLIVRLKEVSFILENKP